MIDKQIKEQKPKMVTTSFRIEEDVLEALKIKSKPANPSAYLRILAKMWLDGRIGITDEDIQKYT
jgi:hypothetical protein